MQRLICIPFGRRLKTDSSKKFCAIEKKSNLKLQNQAGYTILRMVYFYLG